MRTVTFAQGVQELGFTQVVGPADKALVRHNKNGYPFVTFVNPANEAENIYFSKPAAEVVEELATVDEEGRKVIPMQELVKFNLGLVEYDDEREDQWKLTSKGERVELADFLPQAAVQA